VVARQQGLDEPTIAKVDAYESSDLSERHKIALRLADSLMTMPGVLSDALITQLHAEFSREQLIELTLDVMKWNYQKVSVAMRTDVEMKPGELADLAFDEAGNFIRPT
jgi:hypothetical protein